MSNCMTFGETGNPMELFSAPHLVALLLIAFLCLLLISFRNKLTGRLSMKSTRYVFAALILIQQSLLYILYAFSGQWSVQNTLPLQLCDISVFLAVIVLVSRNKSLSELLYFWGLGGATQALLTPALGAYSFPHFLFYQFFISHGLIVLVCLYMVLVEGFRPSFRSVWRTFAITNIYAAVIFPLNFLLGSNYLFLRNKPTEGSILDLLGPWPWYILSLEAVAIISFLLLYLPFAFSTGSSQNMGTSQKLLSS